ncbi:MAG: hypothetical protein AB1714_21230 [Acidobacteriota bacterium]
MYSATRTRLPTTSPGCRPTSSSARTGVRWRELAIRLLYEAGEQEGAVRAARDGVAVHLSGSYLWFLLADILNRCPQLAAPGEAEAHLQRSLSLNARLFDAVSG